MEMLNEEVRDFTRKKFAEELVNPVELIFFMEEKSPLIVPGQPVSTDCQYCPEIKQLLEELSSLSDRIKLTVYDFKKEAARAAEYRLDKIPAIIIKTEIDTGIRFFGIPSGYEYMSLLEAIVDASRGQTELSPATREALKKLKKEVDIQVFVTPTCPYCPMAVRLAHQMALESPLITASMIEAAEFPELTQKYESWVFPSPFSMKLLAWKGLYRRKSTSNRS